MNEALREAVERVEAVVSAREDAARRDTKRQGVSFEAAMEFAGVPGVLAADLRLILTALQAASPEEGWKPIDDALREPQDVPEWVASPFDGDFYREMRARHVEDEIRACRTIAGGNWALRASQWLHAAGSFLPPQGSSHHVHMILADALEHAVRRSSPTPTPPETGA